MRHIKVMDEGRQTKGNQLASTERVYFSIFQISPLQFQTPTYKPLNLSHVLSFSFLFLHPCSLLPPPSSFVLHAFSLVPRPSSLLISIPPITGLHSYWISDFGLWILKIRIPKSEIQNEEIMALLPAIGIGTTVAGTGMSIFGSLYSGSQQAAAAHTQAKLSRLQAEAEDERASAEAGVIRRKARELFSTQRAAYAASGVRLEGTPLLVMADTIRESERDILNVYKQTDARKLAFLTQAGVFEAAGKAAKTASYWNAGSTLLTNISSGINTWKS